jgi:hypothetical protein
VVALGIARELPVEVPMEINITDLLEFGNHLDKFIQLKLKHAAKW